MAQVSHRLRHLNDGGSDGWEVFYRARAMVAAGEPVRELTIGEHDTPTDPAILDAMHRAARAGHTGYAAVPGVAALRDAVAARVEAATGVPTRRDNVLITPGGQAALFAAHLVAGDPGATGLYIDPFYATYPGTIRAAGLRAVALETRAETGFRPTEATFADAPEAASLLVNSPNNPTGAVYGPETLAALARAAQARDLWVISDEVYDGQVWDGAHVSPRALPGMAARTLVVGSMSKSFAMTGSRVGWLVGPEAAIAAATDLATVTTYGVPGYVQEGALWALAQGAALEERIAAPFARRRTLALDLLARQDVVTAIPPQGAMYLMLDIRRTGLSGAAFADRLLDEARIAVMPGESFGRAAAGHVRVAMTLPDADFADALGRMLRFAADLAALPAT